MNKIRQINGNKLSLLFIAAILILCTGFIIASCGNKPQQKTVTEKGAFAVDFSRCPAGILCLFLAEKNEVPNLSLKELTVEAWVKRKTAAVNGGIFSRMDAANGVSLFINNNEPKFAIRVATGASTTTPGVTGSVDYIVGSGFSLVQNTWAHIAGIISNVAHSHVASTTCTSTVMAETPHLDIYVDGAFSDCATTWGDSSDPATGPQFAGNPGHIQLMVGAIQSGPVDTIDSTINAVVDEVRIWSTARGAADIIDCKNTELGIGGTCNRGDNNLVVYYRLNEGEGSDVTDMSGYGLSGSLITFNPDETFWVDGWVAGNPGIQKAD